MTTAGTASKASTSGNIINFDEVRHEVVKVIKRGHAYALRDDIPMEVMVRAFSLKSVGERLQSLQDVTGEEAAATFEEASEDTIPVCADIFRHSYPDTSEDEIAGLFSFEERMELIKVFFQRRLAQLQTRPDATSSDMAEALRAAQEQQAQAEPALAALAPNRALRRATRAPAARAAARAAASRLGTTSRPPR